MKTVSGKIESSKPISLSKAAKHLSNFLVFDNGASQAVSVYLRRTSAAFNELSQFHKELKKRRKNKIPVEIAQIPSEVKVNYLENSSKKKGGFEEHGAVMKREKKKSEVVERESGSDLGVEAAKRKEKKKKKRKNGETEELSLDLAKQGSVQKKKKRRRIEVAVAEQ